MDLFKLMLRSTYCSLVQLLCSYERDLCEGVSWPGVAAHLSDGITHTRPKLFPPIIVNEGRGELDKLV